jgi:hypothetical protein
LPDGIFSNQNPTLGNFWRVLEKKMLVNVMAIGSTLLAFCGHFEYFLVIWYIFSRFGMLYQEKSGSPEVHTYKMRVMDTEQQKESIRPEIGFFAAQNKISVETRIRTYI